MLVRGTTILYCGVACLLESRAEGTESIVGTSNPILASSGSLDFKVGVSAARRATYELDRGELGPFRDLTCRLRDHSISSPRNSLSRSRWSSGEHSHLMSGPHVGFWCLEKQR